MSARCLRANIGRMFILSTYADVWDSPGREEIQGPPANTRPLVR